MAVSDDDDPLNMPIAHVSKLTAVWDAQVSIIDDLLGGPLDLAPSAPSELALALGQTVLLPAAIGQTAISANDACEFLEIYVPATSS